MSDTPELTRLSNALGERYRVDREIGQGGMATVYLAQDLKHGRQVAIKVLRPELYSAMFAERFLAEIRTTAGLQHPHILPLFDSGAADQLLFYVMPFVTGETLRDRLARERLLPVPDAVRIGSDVAGALDYAHRCGVIHRDIKPENILFHDGAAMVADFGIAFSLTATGKGRLTETGLSIGTPAYMSPEQATGERLVDGRTDVYALGAVLYEMLGGTPPHVGDSAGAVLAKVLTRDPLPLETLRPGLAPDLVAVVSKALARDPSDRWQTASALVSALQAPPAHVSLTAPSRTFPVSGRTVFAGATILALAAAWGFFWPTAAKPPAVTSKRQVTFVGNVENVSLSPDGRFLAYAAHGDDSLAVFVQEISGGNAIRLAGFANADLTALNWSPDGSRILITGVAGTTSLAYIIPALGGNIRQLPVSTLVSALVPFGAWIADGNHVALWPENAGVRARLAILGITSGDTSSRAMVGLPYAAQGSWSHEGEKFVITQMTDSTDELWIVPKSGAPVRIARATNGERPLGDPRWSPADDAIFVLRGLSELLRIPLRRDGLTADGPPQILASGLEAWSSGGTTALSFSADARRVVYTRLVQHSNLVLLDADGTSRPLTNTTSMKWNGTLSPDGKTIAFVQRDARGENVWIHDLTSGNNRQLTFNGGVSVKQRTQSLAWSGDGLRLAVTVHQAGILRIGLLDVNGDGQAKMIEAIREASDAGIGWAPSRRLAYTDVSGHEIRQWDPDSRQVTVAVADSGAVLLNALPAADGNSVAYYRMGASAETSGLWAVTGQLPARQLSSSFLMPIGWSANGSALITRSGASRDILRTSLNGQSRVINQSTGRDADCIPGGTEPRPRFVCTTFVSVSDAWIIELGKQ